VHGGPYGATLSRHLGVDPSLAESALCFDSTREKKAECFLKPFPLFVFWSAHNLPKSRGVYGSKSSAESRIEYGRVSHQLGESSD